MEEAHGITRSGDPYAIWHCEYGHGGVGESDSPPSWCIVCGLLGRGDPKWTKASVREAGNFVADVVKAGNR